MRYDKIEIFPKQTKVTDKGGSKINIPLFRDTRKQLTIEGEPIDGLNLSTTPLESFEQPPEREEVNRETSSSPELNCPYPCIDRILQGVENGSRNVIGFELARYMVSQNYPSIALNDVMRDWNERNRPPLRDAEIDTIIRSVKEERCNNAPDCENPMITAFCDKERCKKAETVICEDPLIIRKCDGYCIEVDDKKVGKKIVKATNFTIKVLKADSKLRSVKLIVRYGDDEVTVRLINPSWRNFLSQSNLQGLVCDNYRKVKFIVLLGAEISQDKSIIESTDVTELEYEKIIALIKREINEGNISEFKEGEELCEEGITSGWIKGDTLYFRSGAFCATYHFDTRKLASILRDKNIERISIRTPIEGHPSLKVWVIKLNDQ